MKSQVGRTAQGAQAKPQKQKQGGPGEAIQHGLQAAGNKVKEAANKPEGKRPDKGQGYENAPQVVGDQAHRFVADFLSTGKLPHNPFSPGDWFGSVKDNAEASWHAALDLHDTYSYLIDEKRVASSVRSTWAKNDARSRITQTLMTAVAAEFGNRIDDLPLFPITEPDKLPERMMEFNPMTAPAMAGGKIGESIAGQIMQGHAPQADEQAAEKGLPRVVKDAADPSTYIAAAAPEKVGLQLATSVGPAAAEAAAPHVHELMGGQSPDEQVMTAILWAAMAGTILNMGHIKGPAREYLIKQFANWPKIEGALKGALGAARQDSQASTGATSPGLPDHLTKDLEAANQAAEQYNKDRLQLVSKGTKTRTPDEEVRRLSEKERGARTRLLKQFDARNEDELRRYVLRHPLNDAQTKQLRKSWGKLLFGDPIYQEGLPQGEFLNPQGPLDEITDPQVSQRAHTAVQDFNSMAQLAHGGVIKNDEAPMTSMWRGLVGHNDSLDHWVGQFGTSLKEVDPALASEGKALYRAVEELGMGKRDTYDKLSPAGRYVVDMTRMLANLTKNKAQGAGTLSGEIANFLPRLDERLPVAQAENWQGQIRQYLDRKSGGGGGRVVTQGQKHRALKTVAIEEEAKSAHRLGAEGLLEPLRQELGKAGVGVADDELAPLYFALERMGNAREAVLTSLRKMTPAALKKVSQTLYDNSREMRILAPDHPQARSLKLRVVPAHATVDEANTAISHQREGLVKALQTGDPEKAMAIAKEHGVALPLDDPELKALLKSGNTKAIKAYANRLYRPKVDDLWKVLESGFFERQLKAAHTADVVKEWQRTQIEVLDKATGERLPKMAAYRVTNDTRKNKHFLDLGYKPLENAYGPLQGVAFAPELRPLLERATYMQQSGMRSLVMEEAARLENKAVQLILFNPMFHTLNMVTRLSAFSLVHPWLMVRQLKAGAIPAPLTHGAASEAMRVEAARFGVVTPHGARRMIQGLGSRVADFVGDNALHDLGVQREVENPRLAERFRGTPAGNLLGKVTDALGMANNKMWHAIWDFQVMVFHIEREALQRAGQSPEAAGILAAQRANTWGGHVSDIDHNPELYRLARLTFLAPNWWRTWMQLLIPAYRNAGVKWTPELTGYMVKQGAAAAMAFYVVQKVTGQSLNWVLSGHAQGENEQGKQDDWEISRPEIIGALKAAGYPGTENMDPETGRDTRTGGRLYVENPFGRQVKDTEKFFGFESGQPGWGVDRVWGGAAKTLAARLSPIVSSAAALGNLDLYGTVASGQLRNIDPNHELPPGSNVALAMLSLTPLGFEASGVARAVSHEKKVAAENADAGGAYDTQTLAVIQDMASKTPGLMGRILLNLTGVQPPYAAAEKRAGQQPSDQDYQRLTQIDAQFHQQVTGISQQAMQGEITPGKWREDYLRLSTFHRAQVEALMMGAPDYTQGTLGMVNEWERLYSEATDPMTGQLDADKVGLLQEQFKQKHTSAELDAMQGELRRNDKKYPMLKAYHEALDSFHQWQGEWAGANGLSARQIQSESAEYNALRSDRHAATQYLAEHPELRRYQKARRGFYQSLRGVAYGAFVDSSVALDFARRQSMTPRQLVEQMAGQ